MPKKQCLVCGEDGYKYYPYCEYHLQMKSRGEIEKCDECSSWNPKGELCECKKEAMCQKCGKPSNGKPLCYTCWKNSRNTITKTDSEFANEVEPIKNVSIEPNNVVKDDFLDDEIINKLEKGKCIVCSEKANDHFFCYKCYRKYQNKELLVKIKKGVEVEILHESYESMYTCKDGHIVKSKSEKFIDEYLYSNKIIHAYEIQHVFNDGSTLRPDFHLPELDLYIEHFGRTDEKYLAQKAWKIEKYERDGVTVICTDEKDMNDIDTKLKIKLRKYQRGMVNFKD